MQKLTQLLELEYQTLDTLTGTPEQKKRMRGGLITQLLCPLWGKSAVLFISLKNALLK